MDKQRLLELAGINESAASEPYKEMGEVDDVGLWELADRVMKGQHSWQEKAEILHDLIRWEEGG